MVLLRPIIDVTVTYMHVSYTVLYSYILMYHVLEL